MADRGRPVDIADTVAAIGLESGAASSRSAAWRQSSIASRLLAPTGQTRRGRELELVATRQNEVHRVEHRRLAVSVVASPHLGVGGCIGTRGAPSFVAIARRVGGLREYAPPSPTMTAAASSTAGHLARVIQAVKTRAARQHSLRPQLPAFERTSRRPTRCVRKDPDPTRRASHTGRQERSRTGLRQPPLRTLPQTDWPGTRPERGETPGSVQHQTARLVPHVARHPFLVREVASYGPQSKVTRRRRALASRFNQRLEMRMTALASLMASVASLPSGRG